MRPIKMQEKQRVLSQYVVYFVWALWWRPGHVVVLLFVENAPSQSCCGGVSHFYFLGGICCKQYGQISPTARSAIMLVSVQVLSRCDIINPGVGGVGTCLMDKKVKVHTLEFNSIRQAAIHFGVSDRTVYKRLDRGWTLEQALGIEPPPAGNNKSVKVGGVDYPSVNEAARAYGIDAAVVHNRLRRGKSIDEAFSAGPLPNHGRSKPITLAGMSFGSVKAAAEHYGVDPYTAQWRIRNGWGPEQAMELTPAPIHSRPLTFGGKQYDSIAQLARSYGQDPDLVRRRLDTGRTVEEALGQKEFDHSSKPIPCLVNNQTFPSRDAACRYFGIDKYVVSTRINELGWTLAQALELEPRPGYDPKKMGTTYLVRHKRSQKAYVGVTRTALERRWDEHIRYATKTDRHPRGSLHEAIRSDGASAFEILALATGRTIAELNDLERSFVTSLGTLAPKGFNIRRGGGAGLRSGGISISVRGETFVSIAEAAEYYGVAPQLARRRLRDGYSIEQALGLEPSDPPLPSAHSIDIDGQYFETIKEAAEYYDQPPNRVRNRLHQGWSVEDALKKERTTSSMPVTVSGKKFGSIRAAARELGVHPETLRKRLIAAGKI